MYHVILTQVFQVPEYFTNAFESTTKLLPTDLRKFHIARSRLFIARPVYCASAVV